MYCNYSKDKFDKELTFIIPSWADTKVAEYYKLRRVCGDLEREYLEILEWGATPQEARQLLPNAIKTEVVMTGFASDWRFFFDLRYYGETGKPHPDMELLAGKARSEFMANGVWNDIMKYPSKFDK